jgi:hypothetical protein
MVKDENDLVVIALLNVKRTKKFEFFFKPIFSRRKLVLINDFNVG